MLTRRLPSIHLTSPYAYAYHHLPTIRHLILNRSASKSIPSFDSNLIHHHFLRPSSSTSTQLNPAPDQIQNLTVIGAGLMGSGIAQVAARAGLSVTIHALDDRSCQESKSIIDRSQRRIFKKSSPSTDDQHDKHRSIDSIYDRLTYTTDLDRAIDPRSTDLIIEAIVENLDSKRELFKNLDRILIESPKTIFTSNTSSLKIADISLAVSKSRRSKFAGLHFFNPVPQMKLVEVIKTDQTDPETIERLINFSNRLGKTAVKCTDTPGFIVNRLLVPYLLEAMRMIERGEATKEDIDLAMRLGAGHPMGPIELSDYVGLDTIKFITDGWRHTRLQTAEIDRAFVEPVPSLDRLVKEGNLGRKTKEGYFKY